MEMEELSAVLLLHKVLDEALEQRCSDVHIYTAKDQLIVKFRKHGRLETFLRTEQIGADVVRRVKALARMDVAEARLPQDGAFRWESETMQCDVRASTLPTIHGEAVVLRLFPEQKGPIDFSSLGMNDVQCRFVVDVLSNDAGMVMVTGPTNSGKTTTLYAMMLHLARAGRKVVSIEDPVERPLEDCQQVQVRETIGITFDVGLRAVLRHDPDVIMIGEIRDDKTARAAVRAALTGHLVLTTTHSNDAVGALIRLVEFGISRSLVADVVRGIVVQAFVHTEASRDNPVVRERAPEFEVVRITPAVAQLLGSDTPWWSVRKALFEHVCDSEVRV
jgi:general secretion pathway protein E